LLRVDHPLENTRKRRALQCTALLSTNARDGVD